MLTRRGWWFLVAIIALLLTAALARFVALAILALALLLWFAFEAAVFYWRVQSVLTQIKVKRRVSDKRGPVKTLWAGRKFDVKLEIESASTLGLPFVIVSEFMPFNVEWESGATRIKSVLEPGKPLILKYQIRCLGLGRVRFEGAGLEATDLQGFFYFRRFLTKPMLFSVLPQLLERRGLASRAKHQNVLPPPGVHRFRRPGSGSELLNLRDYLPGDPPKTIAWKVSARRDRLITKEYESEVPVRCTVFVDTSQSVRLGPYGTTLLEPILELTALIVQVNTRSRDLTGLCLFDESKTEAFTPARDPAHVSRILNRLAAVATLTPYSDSAPPEPLVELSYSLAEEIYPHLLKSSTNAVPLGLIAQKQFRAGGRRFTIWGFLVGLIYYAVAVAMFILQVVVYFSFTEVLVKKLSQYREISQYIAPMPPGFHYFVIGFLGIYYLKFAAYVRRALPQIFSSKRRAQVRMRKHMAAVLTTLEQGLQQKSPRSMMRKPGPGRMSLLLESDRLLSLKLQQFLSDHGVPYSLPLYDREGRFQFRSASKIAVLARSLIHAVAIGRDNELFVLAVDLLDLEEDLDPLVKAVGVARAREHQVVLVIPWPAEVRWNARASATASSRKSIPQEMLRMATETRLLDSYHKAAKTFSRLGVTVLRADIDQSMRLILSRIEQIRLGGIRR